MNKKQMPIVTIFIIAIMALSLAAISMAKSDKGTVEAAVESQMCFQMSPYSDIFKLNITSGIVHGTMSGLDYSTPVMGKVSGKTYVLTARNPYMVGLGMIDGTIGFPNGDWWLTNTGDDLMGPSPVTLVPVSCTAPATSSGISAFSK